MIFKSLVEELRAHALMLANLDGTPVFWLHFARIYAELPGRPVMLLGRAETCAILSVRFEGPETMRISYREAGAYFGPEGDEPLTRYTNPVTGKTGPAQPTFREGPAVFTRAVTEQGIIGNTELDQKTMRPMPWTWHSSGSRVWMHNEDAGIFAPADPKSENSQAHSPLSGRILQTWHADGRDLGNPSLRTVSCFKNYMVTTSAWPRWAGDPGEPGGMFIRGMGTKLTAQQADASPEFVRLNRYHADFFGPARTAS